MAKSDEDGFVRDFKRSFLRGLAALLPTLLTIVILVKAYQFVQGSIGYYINEGFMWALVVAGGLPPVTEQEVEDYVLESDRDLAVSRQRFESALLSQVAPGADEAGQKSARERILAFRPDLSKAEARIRELTLKASTQRAAQLDKLHDIWDTYHLSVVGFIVAIVLVYITGFLLASFVGRALWNVGETLVDRIPLVRQIYPSVKQVTDFLFSERKLKLNRVVAIQYPREGLWTLGLVTGPGFRSLAEQTGRDMVSVFIPSSPTPVTGYVVSVPREDVIDLSISIDEALRFTISGGVVVPPLPEPGNDKTLPTTARQEDPLAGRET